MKKIKKLFIYFIVIIILALIYLWWFDASVESNYEQYSEFKLTTPVESVKQDRVEKIEIVDGMTYGNLMSEAGIDYAEAMDLYAVAEPIYDLVKIRLGKFIELVYDKNTDVFKELKYKIDTEDELIVYKVGTTTSLLEASTTNKQIIAKTWQAELKPISYEVKIRTASGVVKSSMYQAALDNDIDIRAIIELANAFQWSIDFAMDPRIDDTFKFVYEERFLDGEYVMPGAVLAGKYVNNGKSFEVYYFEEDENNKGFFDEKGNSVQKMFLKAPVAFKYISSGYTTGSRLVMEFGLKGPHRAIDYAAALGTPIRAVGNGTVTFAGWSSVGYGNLTSIRHNGTYSTNYAHQSKFAVKRGDRVKQGQVIGYVGSTGYSTGPHLHFEMVKNGVKINPLLEVLPPGKPIKDENKDRFFKEIEKYKSEFE